ncbi:MAG TPA: hypothetical protein PKE26_04890 [Kiritimatiellia bacterium]|nr:hypothetical protein [Kiritimatiellia bacterium]
MKYVLVIYEGAAQGPCDDLEGATPLELARNIHATALKARGQAGLLRWPERDAVTRTEQALAWLLGVAPEEARALRRGPLEAAGTAMDRSRWTYAYRGNFITTDGPEIRDNRVHGLSRDETAWLTQAVQEATQEEPVLFEVLGPGRVAVMFDRLDGVIDDGAFPRLGELEEPETAARSSARSRVMAAAQSALARQSINDVRVDLGENPANCLWLWGGGPPVRLGRPFLGAPLRACMITNSPLARGLATLCGMSTEPLGDPWAEAAKPELITAEEIAARIAAHELTVIYVEAPNEGGTFDAPVDCVKSLDRLDIHVLARVVEAVERSGPVRLMVTALPAEGEFLGQTPVLLWGAGISGDEAARWDETHCGEGALGVTPAQRCLSRLIGE